MGRRRGGREICLQSLYLWDNCVCQADDAWRAASAVTANDGEDSRKNTTKKPDTETFKFAKELFDGVLANQKPIDLLLERYSHNWKLGRMSCVDRNIIRMAAYEIIFMIETPVNVIINEAVEVAKAYSTQESGKFVNGILDKFKNERRKDNDTEPSQNPG